MSYADEDVVVELQNAPDTLEQLKAFRGRRDANWVAAQAALIAPRFAIARARATEGANGRPPRTRGHAGWGYTLADPVADRQ